MKVAGNRSAGLTLIEVLVAISLLSLLSVSILMALRVGAGAWERTNTNLMLDRRIATANAIFHAELEGIFPGWAEFDDPATRTPHVFVFFQGQPASMRFLTSYSLSNGPRGGLRLIELLVTDGPRGKRVLLNEQGYGDPKAAGRLVTGVIDDRSGRGARFSFAPIVPQPASFIIADELQNCSFSYLTEKVRNEPQRWAAVWLDPYRLPTAVGIQLTPRQDSARLQPVAVTVPIRATMWSP